MKEDQTVQAPSSRRAPGRPPSCEPGQIYGRLVVLRRAPNYVAPSGGQAARWVCRCECGNVTTVISNDLRQGTTRSCGCLQRESLRAPRANRGSDDISYSTAHVRVARVRGKPSAYECIDCRGEAQQWSHVWGPRSRRCPRSGRWYSPDPMSYVPRCIPCHKRADLAAKMAIE